MLSTPLICASMGAATESASVCESAPGYVADTVTWTGVIVGYCSTGRSAIDTPPAMTITRETTVAKMGCSMKKRENMKRHLRRQRLLFFSPAGAGDFFGSAPCAGPGAAEACL